MALDLTVERLIPLSGVGRVGPQGRVLTLGTKDTLAAALATGYIDKLVKGMNEKTPHDNRPIFSGDLINLQTEYDVDANMKWTLCKVTYVPPSDMYTLVQVEADKINVAFTRQMVTRRLSFETGEQQAKVKVYFNSAVTINKIRGVVVKTVAGTDSGTITAKNSAGIGMATGVLTFAAAAAYNTEQSSSPTSNNTVAKDSFISLETAKTTAGGEVEVTIEYTVTAG